MTSLGIRGQAQEKLVLAVLAVVAITLLSYVVFTFMNGISAHHDDDLCRDSVLTNHLLNRRGVDASADEILCPTKYLTIDKKNEKKEVADELARCWWLHHEGKLELFSKEQIYCSVCTVMRFKDESGTLTGLSEYLRTAEYKDKGTYLSYLASVKTENADAFIQDDNAFSKLDGDVPDLDKSKPYSVIFVYAKGKNYIGELFDYMDKATAYLATGSIFTTGGAAIFFMASPGGWVSAIGASVAGAIIGTVSTVLVYLEGEQEAHTAFIILKEHEKDELQDLGCQVFPAVQEVGRSG